MWGYLIGAGLMLAAAIVELILGPAAEQKSLENVALPLAAEKGRGLRGDARWAGVEVAPAAWRQNKTSRLWGGSPEGDSGLTETTATPQPAGRRRRAVSKSAIPPSPSSVTVPGSGTVYKANARSEDEIPS